MARWFRFGLSVARPFVCGCLTSFTILRFHTPAHRTGLADFPHPAFRLASLTNTRRLCSISVVTPRTSPSSMASKVLSVTAESLMELIGKANLRTLGLFQEHARSQAPFLDRHYPASSVIRTCPPPQTAQPAPHGVLVESHDLSPLGLPVFRRFPPPCMPARAPPAGWSPRRNRWMLSLSRPTTTAFPNNETGPLPHHPFRGRAPTEGGAGVHSRSGLHGR